MKKQYIIEIIYEGRPDIVYYYSGDNKEGEPMFNYKKTCAKDFQKIEDAEKELNILKAIGGPIREIKISTIKRKVF
jgi:hypothetical protein